MDCVKVFNSEV